MPYMTIGDSFGHGGRLKHHENGYNQKKTIVARLRYPFEMEKNRTVGLSAGSPFIICL